MWKTTVHAKQFSAFNGEYFESVTIEKRENIKQGVFTCIYSEYCEPTNWLFDTEESNQHIAGVIYGLYLCEEMWKLGAPACDVKPYIGTKPSILSHIDSKPEMLLWTKLSI